MLSLVMNPGLSDERTYALPEGTVTIGRTNDNDILCVHKSLSRKHARLECNGSKVRVVDLESKNGTFFRGRRVTECEVREGEIFRCGDISFLVEGATVRKSVGPVSIAQTLQSPLGDATGERPSVTIAAHGPGPGRDKQRLGALVRACELLVSDLAIETMIEELVLLAVHLVEVDRIALLTLDEQTLEMRPRVLRTFAGTSRVPFSKRVVDHIVDSAKACAFADVSAERSLRGEADYDADIRSAICVPLDTGSGVIGVLYGDSVSKRNLYGTDVLPAFCALANLIALAIEGQSVRTPGRRAAKSPTS